MCISVPSISYSSKPYLILGYRAEIFSGIFKTGYTLCLNSCNYALFHDIFFNYQNSYQKFFKLSIKFGVHDSYLCNNWGSCGTWITKKRVLIVLKTMQQKLWEQHKINLMLLLKNNSNVIVILHLIINEM